jgi:hypothetical protein
MTIDQFEPKTMLQVPARSNELGRQPRAPKKLVGKYQRRTDIEIVEL